MYSHNSTGALKVVHTQTIVNDSKAHIHTQYHQLNFMQLYWSSDGVRFYSKGVFGYVKVVHINNSAQKYNRHTCKTKPWQNGYYQYQNERFTLQGKSAEINFKPSLICNWNNLDTDLKHAQSAAALSGSNSIQPPACFISPLSWKLQVVNYN